MNLDPATITAIGAAIGLVITAIGTVWVNVTTARATREMAAEARKDAAEAKRNTAATYVAATAAHDQAVSTAKKVDGQTHELLAAVAGKAGAEATLAERDAAHVRKGEAAVAIAKPASTAKE